MAQASVYLVPGANIEHSLYLWKHHVHLGAVFARAETRVADDVGINDANGIVFKEEGAIGERAGGVNALAIFRTGWTLFL